MFETVCFAVPAIAVNMFGREFSGMVSSNAKVITGERSMSRSDCQPVMFLLASATE